MTVDRVPLSSPVADQGTWPSLPLADWQDTHDTLHMWMKIVEKTRLALAPTPLVARPPVRELAWLDYDPHPIRLPQLRGRVRFHRPSPCRGDERRDDPGDRTTCPGSGGLLSRVHGGPRRSRDRRDLMAGARRGRPSNPFPRGSPPCLV